MSNFKIINIPLSPSKYAIKAPAPMKPIGITIHETDNNASARNEVAYMQRNNNMVSFHFAVDEKEIIQGLPLDRHGWHAGDWKGKGNTATIGIEIARNFERPSGKIPNDYYKARENAERLAGYLLHKYNWTDKDMYMHYDWNRKNCPRRIREQGYWNTFKKNAMKYKAEFAGSKPVVPSKPKPTPPSKPASGTTTIKAGAKYRSLAAKYDGKTVPKQFIGKSMAYKEGLVSGKDWIYFPSLQSYVSKSDTALGSAPKPTPKPTPTPSGTKVVAESGYFKPNRTVQIKNTPKTSAGSWGQQAAGDEFEYDAYTISDGHVWVRSKKLQKWVPWRVHNGEKFGSVRLKTAAPKPKTIKVGDKVVVRSGSKSYSGQGVTSAWYTTPKVVSEISGDRVVLDARSWNTAFRLKDLIKV